MSQWTNWWQHLKEKGPNPISRLRQHRQQQQQQQQRQETEHQERQDIPTFVVGNLPEQVSSPTATAQLEREQQQLLQLSDSDDSNDHKDDTANDHTHNSNSNSNNNSNNDKCDNCTTTGWKWPKSLHFVEGIVKNMGNCLGRATGAAMLIENADGDEEAFHKRYIEDRVLGEGEFGVVNLVHDMTQTHANPGASAGEADSDALACKTIRKGVIFKDNILYAPLKAECLQAEVNILRTLAGQHFCLGLKGVYETTRVVLVITEYCPGGEMMEYVSKQEQDLRTEDVSRISFQLIDAVSHCASHNIIHRDIKPENLMFMHSGPGSELRLIDFGSGTDKLVEGNHTTFAGSAFYISPEMFQRTYTIKTDVWSAGVTLYVLVAGYPADVLQRAFNMLQDNGERDLRNLPNMPDDMPDSYYEMLDAMLVYRHKKRKNASEILDYEFVRFHKVDAQEASTVDTETDEITDLPTRRRQRTHSISIRGSVTRHSMFLDYQKFERSVTTLLATMLDKAALTQFMRAIKQHGKDQQNAQPEPEQSEIAADAKPRTTTLEVIQLNEMKAILEDQEQSQVLSMLSKLPNAEGYAKFAYHVNLLKEFTLDDDRDGSMRRRGSFRGSSAKVARDSSIRSAGSMRGRRASTTSSSKRRVSVGAAVNTSIHTGGGVFQEWKKKDGSLHNPRKNKNIQRSVSLSKMT